jgi:hypothetical protein
LRVGPINNVVGVGDSMNITNFQTKTLLIFQMENFKLRRLIVNLLVGWVDGATVIFGTADVAIRKNTRQVSYKDVDIRF